MRRIVSILVMVCIVVVMMPLPASAAIYASGNCGNNAYWQLDDNGTLTIYGRGETKNYRSVRPPWQAYSGMIKNVVIKQGITNIPFQAFTHCSALENVTIANSVTSIDDQAFYRCVKLNHIVLPSNLEFLGSAAFYESGIETISIPEKISIVNSNLFYDCPKLTSVIFKGHIIQIGGSAFLGCDLLETVTFEKGNSGYIGKQAFHNCSKLQSFSFDEGITSIGELAFSGCHSLQSIDLPESLTSIGGSAFSETNITSVTIPKAVNYLGSHVFSSCFRLQSATMYTEAVEGLKGNFGGDVLRYVHIIGDAPNAEKGFFNSDYRRFLIYYDEGTSGWAPPMWKEYLIEPWGTEEFSRTGVCGDDLTWLIKDDVLTISGTGDMYHYVSYSTTNPPPWYIYRNWFYSVVIEDGVTSIGNNAFQRLEKLKSVTIPGSVKEIGSQSFEYCNSLTEITIPDGVESIAHGAFTRCAGLNTVTMADSVKTLGPSTFSGCTNLTSVRLSKGLTLLPEACFSSCQNLQIVTIPDGITNLGRLCFSDCAQLTKLDLPNSLVSIEDSALARTGLVEITIPASVNTIKHLVFLKCNDLRQIRFLGDAPTFSMNVFCGITTLGIYPAGNTTWTEDVRQDYEGTLIWISDDHVHSYEKSQIEPTCTEQGYTRFYCSSCGHTYQDDYTEALGHDMAEATCTKPSTCKRENCNYKEGSVLKHTWIDPCMVTRTCSMCGYSDNNGGHNWADPSCENLYCLTCGHYEGKYFLDLTGISGEIWTDGVVSSGGSAQDARWRFIENPDAKVLIAYTYENESHPDPHARYPKGMNVYKLTLDGDRYIATPIEEFDNLLQYTGSSIRISGKKGIRMITAIEKSKKEALTGDGLAGYKLVEYGTALCWAKDLDGGKPLVLGQEYVKSNYAYKRGVADPIFAQANDLVQYTNVLVGFTLEQCKDDIAMRPYIILEDADGQQVTLYGGIVYRSIGYIAYQNRRVFRPGTYAYEYVWEIIRAVYGAKYNAEYQG